MNIVIAGNLGYVGSSVVRRLRTSYPDGKLTGIDMGFFSGCITNPDFLAECMMNEQRYNDIRTVQEELFEGVDHVVHLAGVSNDSIGNRFEAVTYDINYQASISLAAKAKRAGVKSFIFASSCSIYGFAQDGAKLEDSSLDPLTAYAKSKVMTEKALEKMADGNFKVTCLRFSTACGMSDRLRLDLVLNDFVAGAVTSKKITILSDGTPWRPLINVKDMARAIDWAITRETADERDFLAINVGCDEWNYQVRDLAEAVAAVIPGVKIEINQNAMPDKRSYRVNFSLFRKLAPDHQPQVDLNSTIRELETGLRTIGFNEENFRNNPKYIRLYTLNMLLDKGLINDKLTWC